MFSKVVKYCNEGYVNSCVQCNKKKKNKIRVILLNIAKKIIYININNINFGKFIGFPRYQSFY